jgi:hypothetical protein
MGSEAPLTRVIIFLRARLLKIVKCTFHVYYDALIARQADYCVGAEVLLFSLYMNLLDKVDVRA